MNWADRDMFEVWRLVLGTICTVYAVVVTARSLWNWVVYLSAPAKVTSVMRQYAIVSILRLRVRRFTGELLQIAFWAAALVVLLDLHRHVAWAG